MSSEFSCETSDEASENELLDRSLSVWRGWSAIEKEDFTPVPLDLHTACSIGQYDWVRSIIARNDSAALDKKNKGGWTSLMYACYIGHDNIVNLLVKAGCQMNKLKNPRGHTPLMLAASCGNENVARTLVRNGAELEVMDKSGWTALFHATYAGHQNFVDFLLEAGANINAVEPTTGLSPFMLAATEGHEIIVQLFLRHGVSVQAKSYNGDMARSLALIKGYMKIVSLIDNHNMPANRLRSEPGLDFYLSSSDEDQPRQHRAVGHKKLKGPSIRDGPDAIARMIDRSRSDDIPLCTDAVTPKGYMSFSSGGGEKGGTTQLSFREVTSPINPDDYKDTSGGTDFDEFDDDSNAFSKTGAITIKSSSSSSGGLVAALGLSREGSLDSEDSRCCDLMQYDGGQEEMGYLNSTDGMCQNEDCDGKGSDKESKAIVSGVLVHERGERGGGENERMDNIPVLKLTSEEPFGMQSDNGLIKEKPRAVVSPLRDYFPLDVSFPPVTETDASNTTNTATQPNQMLGNRVDPQSRQLTHAHMCTYTHTHGGRQNQNLSRQPPRDSMSHSEIVSAYFDSMPSGTTASGQHIHHVEGRRVKREDGFIPVQNSESDQVRRPDLAERSHSQQDRTPINRSSATSSGYSENYAGNPYTIPPPQSGSEALIPRSWSGSAHTEQRHLNANTTVTSQQYNIQSVLPPFVVKDGIGYHIGHHQLQHPSSTHISSATSYPPPLSSPNLHFHHNQPPHHHHRPTNTHYTMMGPNHQGQSGGVYYHPPHSSNNSSILLPHFCPPTPPYQQITPQQHQYPFHHHHPQQTPPPQPPPQPPPKSTSIQNLETTAKNQHHHYTSPTNAFFEDCPQEFYGAPPGHPSFDPDSYFKSIPSDIYYSDMNTISALQIGNVHFNAENKNLPPDHSEICSSNIKTSDNVERKIENRDGQDNRNTIHSEIDATNLLHPYNQQMLSNDAIDQTSASNKFKMQHIIKSEGNYLVSETTAATMSSHNKHSHNFITPSSDLLPSKSSVSSAFTSVAAPAVTVSSALSSPPSSYHGSKLSSTPILQQSSDLLPSSKDTTKPKQFPPPSTTQRQNQDHGVKDSIPSAFKMALSSSNVNQHHIHSTLSSSSSLLQRQQNEIHQARKNNPTLGIADSNPLPNTKGNQSDTILNNIPTATNAISNRTQEQSISHNRDHSTKYSAPSHNYSNRDPVQPVNQTSSPGNQSNPKLSNTSSLPLSSDVTSASPASKPKKSALKVKSTVPHRSDPAFASIGISPAPNSVIIPGHTMSQPVSQSIGWLELETRERGGARDLCDMLTQLGLPKYLDKFEEQDVDLQVFLSLTDNDLKEVGIKLFGPRKKMANAIARWHSQAPLPSNSLEQAYADRLEGEMQELAIQLNQAYATEERLKAQVLQEQQLRSVTESCLMEVRGHWEKTRQTMEEAHGTMRSMNDALARLRLNHKEMRKTIDDQTISESPATPALPPSTSITVMTTTTAEVAAKKDSSLSKQHEEHSKGSGDTRVDTSVKPLSSSAVLDLIRKSEKYLKEMNKSLSALMCNADTVLKSTKDLSTLDKGLGDI